MGEVINDRRAFLLKTCAAFAVAIVGPAVIGTAVDGASGGSDNRALTSKAGNLCTTENSGGRSSVAEGKSGIEH